MPMAVPDWTTANEITCAWDVVFSADGLIILEGNHTIGLQIPKSSQLLAADGTLGELLEVWLYPVDDGNLFA